MNTLISNEMFYMRKAGFTYADIGKYFGISRNDVRRIIMEIIEREMK